MNGLTGATGLTLLVPEARDPERDAVCSAWQRAGGDVVRVGRFWDPPAVDRSRARVYGHDTFCLVLAEKLGLALVAPDDRLLVSLPRDLLSRDVSITHLADVTFAAPLFVKPVVPKQFAARIHLSHDSLAALTDGLSPDTHVFVSDVVRFEAEARAFVLDGEIRTCAVYEGEGDPNAAVAFASSVAARAPDLPRTCVIDVGRLANGEWAVVELNATWGAGLNGCDAERVVECLAAACTGG